MVLELGGAVNAKSYLHISDTPLTIHSSRTADPLFPAGSGQNSENVRSHMPVASRRTSTQPMRCYVSHKH